MASIPGKSCGTCAMCCKVLEIEHFKKPAGDWCAHCLKTGGCGIYKKRPQVCREFECLWLSEREIGPMFKPDRIATLFMIDADTDDYLAVCDPSDPMAWRDPFVFKFLVAKAKEGHTVLAKAGLKAWRIYGSGQWTPWS